MFDRIFKPGADRALLALLLLAGLLMLYRLDGTAHKGRYDDVDRALVARTMVESGDWVVPRLGIHPLFTKPPLMYWITAGLGKITGRRDELPGDLTSVLSMLIVLACTWWIARSMFGKPVALRAGLILSTMYFFVDMSRHTLMDTVLTATMMICAGALFQLVADGQRSRSVWWVAAGVAFAAVIMTKGPVGLPVLALIAVPLLWGQRGIRLRWWQGVGLLLLMLALILPWFILVLHRMPEAADVWRAELFGRMGENELTGTWPTHPAWFYIPQLVGTMPWLPFLIPALGFAWSRRKQRTWLVLLSWFVGGFLFLSLVSSSKRTFYLLPLYPAMAIMIAAAWPTWFAPGTVVKRGIRIASALVVGMVPVGGLIFLGLPLRYPGVPRGPFWVAGILAVAIGVWGVRSWRRSRGEAVIPPVVIGVACLFLAWFGHLVPRENDYISGRPFLSEAARMLGPHKVIMVELRVPLTLFYLGSPPYLNEPRDLVRTRLAEDPLSKVVAKPEIAAQLDFLTPVMIRTLKSPWGETRQMGLYQLQDPVDRD
ncbi:phospholipid carrier-dependent glycosyltransferase [bacterium]|nr:phospholipid carrier-dependent glycosyltransferase [bacterium]PJA74886.1 MAG: hypothetical protein CO151_08050 [bacterium CG_4_9_14_3_um_filter_65_15]